MITRFETLLNSLPEITCAHARTAHTYEWVDQIAKETTAASAFSRGDAEPVPFGGFGDLRFPYVKMGAVDSLDLFGADELIIFAFYLANRARYKKAADIGANIGLHSTLMGLLGWKVDAYEPDSVHAKLLQRNLDLNGVKTVKLHEAAVSDAPGRLEFIRVVGNTTSSHLAGAKSNPYGELERFPVDVVAIAEVLRDVDFVKIDAEGQERIILLATHDEHWKRTEMMIEVGSPENAAGIHAHLTKLGVNMFAQKLGWRKVGSLADMPTSYRDGSLFISRADRMPWGSGNE